MMCACEPFRVFVVEDEPLLVMDLELLIQRAGGTMTGDAGTLTEALNHDRIADADLFLVDIQLRNGSSGIELAACLREQSDPLIVFVTANPTFLPNDLGPGDAVLTKPIYERAFDRVMRFLKEGERHRAMPTDPPGELVLSDRLRLRWQV